MRLIAKGYRRQEMQHCLAVGSKSFVACLHNHKQVFLLVGFYPLSPAKRDCEHWFKPTIWDVITQLARQECKPIDMLVVFQRYPNDIQHAERLVIADIIGKYCPSSLS